jgi:hypothetical protein
MKVRNSRGPAYGAAGAAAAIAVCLGAMVIAPAVAPASPAPVGPRGLALAAHHQHGEHGPNGGDCTLIVPANPLSAAGLATPYQLSGGCTMADAVNQGAFVQATIAAPDGSLSVYDPLVITEGTTPAVPPVVPSFPAGSTVGIWTGFNGNMLRLTGPGARSFVQGTPGSLFGQVAAANAAAFFAAAGKAVIPALGTGLDGKPCPSVRDFSLVDQDQSDNVTSQYLINANGQTAQDTKANVMTMLGAKVLGNGSDNRLLTHFVDPALGCVPFTAPDLADGMAPASSQALDELQAARDQQAPVALVPPNDPMTTVRGALSLDKTNAYRANVDQPALTGDPVAAAAAYCTSIQAIAPPRLAADAKFEGGSSPTAGMTLAQFMLGRYQASLVLLNCAAHQ